MSARSVVVVMPFGGKSGTDTRRAILNYKRLEYIVSKKCEVESSPGSETPVAYAVSVANTATEKIATVLDKIEKADIMIALVSEQNPNVLFELGYRRARNPTVILVVGSPENLPIYESDVAYQRWAQAEVLARIETIANDSYPLLPDFTVGIDESLRQVIDANDAVLVQDLQNALQEIEKKFVFREGDAVRHLRGIVSDETQSFYPSSIVKVSFSGRGKFDDAKPPEVVDFDEEFCRLYNYAGKASAEKDRPLTLAKLVERIRDLSDETDRNEFYAEQEHLTATVIRGGGFARATVPMRFNGEHSHASYRNSSILPCLIAQVVDGNPDGWHRMFLLVVYIPIPDALRPKPAAGS